tara:strand:+ start:175 stop:1059 length:885 start_codon:yes stop_codon:yes gene_type:complete
MEMIDVLKKLQEIAETKPELVKDAVENVTRTNPKVDEGRMKDYLHSEAEKLSREEFLKKHGESLRGFYNAINGSEDDDNDMEEGKMPAGLKAYHDKKAEKKDKKDMKEAIQISADTPQEAGMMMQILKLAGVQPMGADMPSMEPEHGSDMDPGAMNKQMDTPNDDDAMGSMQMAKMRDMVTAPDQEKQDETFANEPEEKVQDIDSLVNKHSGGLNRQKQQFPKSQDGDNAMTVAQEDKITEEELANSLRTQYESFKQAYQEAAKPDYIDLDKDGNKTEPMKKAAKDKEEKEKAK